MLFCGFRRKSSVKRLMLVDGSNLLFQMFYGMPSRIVNRDGKPIQGTLGFVGALLKMIRMIHPTHLAVFFDGECANPRQKLDGEYKANRVDYSQMAEEDTPFYQLPDIFRHGSNDYGSAFSDWTTLKAAE